MGGQKSVLVDRRLKGGCERASAGKLVRQRLIEAVVRLRIFERQHINRYRGDVSLDDPELQTTRHVEPPLSI